MEKAERKKRKSAAPTTDFNGNIPDLIVSRDFSKAKRISEAPESQRRRIGQFFHEQIIAFYQKEENQKGFEEWLKTREETANATSID